MGKITNPTDKTMRTFTFAVLAASAAAIKIQQDDDAFQMLATLVEEPALKLFDLIDDVEARWNEQNDGDDGDDNGDDGGDDDGDDTGDDGECDGIDCMLNEIRDAA